MKKALFVMMVVPFALAALGLARADDGSLKTTLQARYAAMKVAMESHDDKRVAALLASNFVSIDVSGQTEGATQMIGEVDALPKDPSMVSSTTILSIKRAGDSANVTQRYDMKKVKTAAYGSKQNIELITLSSDTWIKSSGSWVIQRSETDQLDYYVNGNRVVHKVRSQ